MADIRFKRLGVTVFDTTLLRHYFTNRTVMDRACLYFDVDEIWAKTRTDTLRDTITFLESLYELDFPVFVQLLSYIVNQLPEYLPSVDRRARIMGDLGVWRSRVMGMLPRFFNELRTLGVSWDGQKLIPTVGTHEIDHQISNKLAQQLNNLGKPHLDTYNGAIEALMSSNPDGLRQSIGSMRELLTKVLHDKTQNEQFIPQERVDGKANGHPTRKARMKKILSKSKGLSKDAKVSGAIIDMVVSTANLLSSKYHPTTEKDREQIHFVFKCTEYLLYYILTQS